MGHIIFLKSRALRLLCLFFAVALTAIAQNPPTPAPGQPSTRPPEHNDQSLRPLTPEEIPPNLNFYAIDPLYKPGTPLGWATERIEEKLDRGMTALAVEGGKVYLSWRLLKTDPEQIAFNGEGSVRPFIDVNAFINPAAFTYGNTPATGAYGLRSPHFFNQDLSLSRNFQILENLRFVFGADGFNIFNNVRLGGINTNITNANFGRASAQTNLPRVFQFKLRVEF